MAQPVSPPLTARRRAIVIALDRLLLSAFRHWLSIFLVLWGIFIALPWLAPVLMKTGNESAANAIYLIYSTQCHQLPERSFFVFGPKAMYSLDEIKPVWRDTDNPMILRQFIGNAPMGWKVAWSDRMVSMYAGVFAAALLFGLARKRARPLPLWIFSLLILPMAIDGGTHFISDLAGIGAGFRDSNAWLAALTANVFPPAFYAGDALGSFNSWMRLITGVPFGFAVVGLAFPSVEELMPEAADDLESKLRRAGVVV
jgi:uncharacterized membrane protein